MLNSQTITEGNVKNPSLENIAEVQDFWVLLKPRVMSLSIFSALVGLILAPGEIHPVLGFTAILLTALGAGSAGALNMWFEGDIDARMERTKTRPIPMGRLTPGAVLGFGLTLGIAAVSLMGLLINLFTASLLAFTILFYVVVYTMWLKSRTTQNIVIGGVSGALPPLIGWAAVTGSLSLEPMLLFAIIFSWTPAHFWALAILCKDDYNKANLPMLPNVAGMEKTYIQILIYTGLTVAVSFTPYILGFSGAFYGVIAIGFGLFFIWKAVELYLKKEEKNARSLFFTSIFYLFAIFSGLALDRLLFGGAG